MGTCRCVGQRTSVLYDLHSVHFKTVSCGSRKDRTDSTVLELSGQDCLSQLVTTICYVYASDAIAITCVCRCGPHPKWVHVTHPSCVPVEQPFCVHQGPPLKPYITSSAVFVVLVRCHLSSPVLWLVPAGGFQFRFI